MTEPAANSEPAATEAPQTAVPVTPDASLIAAPAPEAASAPAAPAAPSRPEGLPDAYWDEANGVKPEAYARLAELEAAEAARAEGVPEKAEDYRLEPTEPVLGEDGKPVALDTSDPLAQAALGVFVKHKLPQAAVSDLMQAFVQSEIEGAKAVAAEQSERRAAEIKKLGATEDAVKTRTAAVHGQLVGALGAEHAEAIRSVMTNASAFLALEALVSKLQGPAITAAPLAGKVDPDHASILYPSSVN
ncbi:hypothetical protein [Brevundimonas sp.]|uniref:hypothetical protein n=1 Tax=Brevundimonas sp. TaxID=1871086 RepID=UPI0035AF5F20